MAKAKSIPVIASSQDVLRFWHYVAPTDSNGCYKWKGKINRGGYGSFWMNGKNHIAHRVSFMIYYRTDPGEMLICHKCDVRRCVNPHHLFLGDIAVNVADRTIKGRTASGSNHGSKTKPDSVNRGERHVKSKLTEEAIRVIRASSKSKQESYTQLAKRFNVSKGLISNIIARRTWKHIE